MARLNEIIEVISEDTFSGDHVDNGIITTIISNTNVIVNLLSDTSLYCRVELNYNNQWIIKEDL